MFSALFHFFVLSYFVASSLFYSFHVQTVSAKEAPFNYLRRETAGLPLLVFPPPAHVLWIPLLAFFNSLFINVVHKE